MKFADSKMWGEGNYYSPDGLIKMTSLCYNCGKRWYIHQILGKVHCENIAAHEFRENAKIGVFVDHAYFNWCKDENRNNI